MSTPTAAGMIASTVGITEPTVAPLPRCASGINAIHGETNGIPLAVIDCSSVAGSMIDAHDSSLSLIFCMPPPFPRERRGAASYARPVGPTAANQPGQGWAEVADGVFQRRYDPLDVSVCVVRGGDELLLVDTRSSHRQADQIRDDLQVFGAATIRAVVNTHAHFDHSFGNGRFGPDSDLDLPIYGHRLVAAHHDRYERPMLADWIERGEEPIDEWREV